MKTEAQDLLIQLAEARELSVAQRLVRALEREVGFTWRAVGGQENNYGLINIGSDPGYALVERVTNAVDAVIEREALRRLSSKGSSMPASPREAIEVWFEVPGGRVANVDTTRRQELANGVVVRLLPSTERRRPTVEIRDLGLGLTPRLIPVTILSLGGSNKIDKPYLAGAFGQGGSTALAFSPHGTLFVSRRQPELIPEDDCDLLAVTFARYNELDARKNKNGRYEYLITPEGTVAGLSPSLLPGFAPGTSVVHFDLEIYQYAARLTQLTGSLWWLLQNALFDPVLPIWAEEHRSQMLGEGKPIDRRTIAGNYTRLSDERNERIEHSDSVDVVLTYRGEQTGVRVNYWVMKEKEDNPQPIESYVDPYRPIAYTYFGQTHGSDERRFTAERLQLPYLAKFLILQVELDHLKPSARRDLLSSTRDRLKQSSFLNHMREQICTALGEDEELIRLNDARKERLLARHSEKDREKIRERFARLMERFTAGIDASAPGQGSEPRGRPARSYVRRDPPPALPTRDYPSFIRIANVQKPVRIRSDRNALLRLESDAPDGYLASHVHAKLGLGCEPEGVITMESRSDFRGGRARMVIRPSEGARPGDKGGLTVFLFTPSDETFNCRVTFEVERPEEAPSAGSAGHAKVQVPEPVPIYQQDWGTLGWNEDSVAEVEEDEKDTKILVNMDNRHIRRLLYSGSYQEVGVNRMKNAYLLYTGFYAYAQYVALAVSSQ